MVQRIVKQQDLSGCLCVCMLMQSERQRARSAPERPSCIGSLQVLKGLRLVRCNYLFLHQDLVVVALPQLAQLPVVLGALRCLPPRSCVAYSEVLLLDIIAHHSSAILQIPCMQVCSQYKLLTRHLLEGKLF